MKIFVTFQVAGFHSWPTAPAEFGYLADTHRHQFHFRVEIEVEHNERAVEMINFQSVAREFVVKRYPAAEQLNHVDFGANSVESLADTLDTDLSKAGYRVTRIEVSEDGENGCVLD